MVESQTIAERVAALRSRLGTNEVRQNELWQQFAELRARSLAAGEITGELTRSDRRMRELDAQRRQFGDEIERVLRERDARERLRNEALNKARQQAAAAEAAYEQLRADIEAELQADADYREAAQAYERSRQTLGELETRLADARSERDAKRQAYENDPLFVYLLKRGYATQEYTRWGWARRIDNWIADIVHFNNAYADYSLLNDMPAWLEENIERVSTLLHEHERALARYWQQLARAGELRQRRENAEQARHTAESQAEANAQEIAHEQAVIDARPAYEARDDIYAREMRELYRRSFAHQPLTALRTLAAQTTTSLDVQAIDDLARLQAEHADLSQRLASLQIEDNTDADDVEH